MAGRWRSIVVLDRCTQAVKVCYTLHINNQPLRLDIMTNDFKLGYITAQNDDPTVQLDDKSPAFIAGFTQYLHEQALLAGNEDMDSFDY